MRRPATAWELIQRGGVIDAETMLSALHRLRPTDVRSDLLIRDGLRALAEHWGPVKLHHRLEQFPVAIVPDHADEVGFSNLCGRIVDATKPETLFQFLRELGLRLGEPTQLVIGGSMVLMIDLLIVRTTDDIDLVDEIPKSLREEPALMAELSSRYGLSMTHFQSHYLPDGWATRTQSMGIFDKGDGTENRSDRHAGWQIVQPKDQRP